MSSLSRRHLVLLSASAAAPGFAWAQRLAVKTIRQQTQDPQELEFLERFGEHLRLQVTPLRAPPDLLEIEDRGTVYVIRTGANGELLDARAVSKPRTAWAFETTERWLREAAPFPAPGAVLQGAEVLELRLTIGITVNLNNLMARPLIEPGPQRRADTWHLDFPGHFIAALRRQPQPKAQQDRYEGEMWVEIDADGVPRVTLSPEPSAVVRERIERAVIDAMAAAPRDPQRSVRAFQMPLKWR